jgi:hypothetical protein
MSNCCAICLQEFDDISVKLISMPCCANPNSSMQYCLRCIEIIAQNGIDENGKCPTCNKYYKIVNNEVETAILVSICSMCRQMKVITNPSRKLCELCTLGSNYTFTYECNKCHKFQNIPHPMWMYQPNPREFGSATWACHQSWSCEYTNWRIVARDLERLPLQHTPPSWGQREEVILYIYIYIYIYLLTNSFILLLLT